MTGCFSCFSLPKVKHDVKEFKAPGVSSGRSIKERARPLTGNKSANDKHSNVLLKQSKKGAAGVLTAVEELSTQEWCSGLTDGAIRARASAINCCIDTLLAPVIGAVEAMVGKPGTGAEGGWEVLQLRDIVKMATAVAESATSCSMVRLGEGVDRLLSLLLSIWKECDPRWESARGTTFQNQSINMLLGMVSIVLCRQVAHDSETVWRQRQTEWHLVRGAFGLEGAGLGVALSPPNKSLLVYLLNASEHGEGKLSLRVQRELALHETVTHLQYAGKLFTHTGAVKVFPLFMVPGENGAVEAGEGHGPRKEFFVEAGAGMVHDKKELRGNPPIFTYVRSAGQYSLNLSLPRSAEMEALAWTAGWIAGQTVANRSLLGAPLPLLLFERLLRGDKFEADMGVLDAFDPEAALAIKNTTRLQEAEFRQMLDLEDCAGMTRDEYTQHAVASALGVGGDSGWIFEAFQNGFWSVLPKSILLGLHVTAEDLRAMVCGPASSHGSNDDFVVEKVFRIVLDEELGGEMSTGGAEEAPAAPLAKALWEVVGAWPPELKRKFVLFCTGSDRLPLPGTELLRVELPFVAFSASDQKKMLGMLPQAHTCENVLELPNYWEAVLRVEGGGSAAEELGSSERKKLYDRTKRVLEERLLLAVTTCNSYGLDEGVGGEGAPGAAAGVSSSYVTRPALADSGASPRAGGSTLREFSSASSEGASGELSRAESGSESARQQQQQQQQYMRVTSTNTILAPSPAYLSALTNDTPAKHTPTARRDGLAPIVGPSSSRGGGHIIDGDVDDSPGLQVLDLDGWGLPGSMGPSSSKLEPVFLAKKTQRDVEYMTRFTPVKRPLRDSSIDDLISDLGVGTLTL